MGFHLSVTDWTGWEGRRAGGAGVREHRIKRQSEAGGQWEEGRNEQEKNQTL